MISVYFYGIFYPCNVIFTRTLLTMSSVTTFPIVGARSPGTPLMLTGARTQFGHSRRLNNVPYVPGDDLPVLSDESIFEGVVSAYDAVRVRCLAIYIRTFPKEHGYGYDNNRILDENFKPFDFE
jgi:hypothetical protein